MRHDRGVPEEGGARPAALIAGVALATLELRPPRSPGRIARALAPLGIEYAPDKGGPGPDIGPLAAQGATWAWLAQDGTDYFDLHHTADDTLDKIDPAALAQNVAAYAVFAYLAAEADGDFGSSAKSGDAAP